MVHSVNQSQKALKHLECPQGCRRQWFTGCAYESFYFRLSISSENLLILITTTIEGLFFQPGYVQLGRRTLGLFCSVSDLHDLSRGSCILSDYNDRNYSFLQGSKTIFRRPDSKWEISDAFLYLSHWVLYEFQSW